MILIDFNQIAISNASIVKIQHDGELVIEKLRHQILNSLRKYNQQFKDEFGELVICCDGNNYWRQEIFPQYKAWRKEHKNSSEHKAETDDLFEKIDLIRDELRGLLPYHLIRFDNLEADDIIAILALYIEQDTIIISADKDFQQLHKNTLSRKIHQYSPLKKEFVRCESPRMFLKELIIRGDKGDGIPNIFGADDSIINKTRAKPIRHTDIEKWLYSKPEDFCESEIVLRNYERNKKLIAFSEIPEDYKNRVLSDFSNQKINKPGIESCKSKMNLYFDKFDLRQLKDKIQEFF